MLDWAQHRHFDSQKAGQLVEQYRDEEGSTTSGSSQDSSGDSSDGSGGSYSGDDSDDDGGPNNDEVEDLEALAQV